MKLKDAKIGMYVEYMNGKHNTFGDIIQIGNRWSKTEQDCKDPTDMIYIQPRQFKAPGGLLGDPACMFEIADDPGIISKEYIDLILKDLSEKLYKMLPTE